MYCLTCILPRHHSLHTQVKKMRLSRVAPLATRHKTPVLRRYKVEARVEIIRKPLNIERVQGMRLQRLILHNKPQHILLRLRVNSVIKDRREISHDILITVRPARVNFA